MKKTLFSLLLVVFLCASFCIPASATFSIFNYPGGVPPKSSLYLLVNYDYYLHINGTTYYVPSGTTIYEGVTSQYTCTARRALDYCDDLDSRFNCGIGDFTNQYFSSSVKTAATNFQTNTNYYNPTWTQISTDGIVGNQTWARLNWYCVS